MAMVKKSITVTEQQESWIQSQMATGNYGTDSELIREALREKQARSAEVEAIRAALIESEESGEPQPFDGNQFKQEMIAKHAVKSN